MSDTILLTGGTGFLGMELIARLLEHEDGPDIVIAVRARDDGDVDARIAAPSSTTPRRRRRAG